jgi:hypothetical protein
MHQQLWRYKVEEKLYVGVREQNRLNTAGLGHGWWSAVCVCVVLDMGHWRLLRTGPQESSTKQDRQCTYNVTLRRVHVIIVAVEKQ